jgi:hypothetical protein
LRHVLRRDSRSILKNLSTKLGTINSSDVVWSVAIDPEEPLQFNSSEVDDRIFPDLYCKLETSTGPWPFTEQSVVLRVWSESDALSYRPEIDAPAILDALREMENKRRVLTRLHFDCANARANEPRHHFQVGGHSTVKKNELCWHPSNLRVPRIPCPPMDILLACELIVANFFPDFYSRKKNEPEWRSLIRSAHCFLVQHYETCGKCLGLHQTSSNTVLEEQWNP